MDRAAISRMVAQKLVDPDFRRRLTAMAPDGTRPILVGLRTDLLSDMVARVAVVGGAANVVVPWLNGIVVFTLTAERRAGTYDDCPADRHLGECSLGVFLERVALDGGNDTSKSYVFMFGAGPGDAGQARAEVVAVAG